MMWQGSNPTAEIGGCTLCLELSIEWSLSLFNGMLIVCLIVANHSFKKNGEKTWIYTQTAKTNTTRHFLSLLKGGKAKLTSVILLVS